MAILNIVTKTAADGTISVESHEERSVFQTIGDTLISPLADTLVDDGNYVPQRTRGYAALSWGAIGFLSGEYYGHKRERAGKGPVLGFLKA